MAEMDSRAGRFAACALAALIAAAPAAQAAAETEQPAPARAQAAAGKRAGQEAQAAIALSDSALGPGRAQGSAELGGGLYLVRFYEGAAADGPLPAEPTRSWLLKTGADGVARFDGTCLVSGDGLYPSLPRGALSVEEVAPPMGYAAAVGASVVPCDGSFEGLSLEKTVKRGDCSVAKSSPSGAPVEGVLVDLYNASASPVASPATGAAVEPGGLVCTIASDASGYASTRAPEANGWSAPGDWAGSLAYGTYWAKERVPGGVEDAFGPGVGTAYDWTFVVTSDGSMLPTLKVASDAPQTWLTVDLVDSATGEPVSGEAGFAVIGPDGSEAARCSSDGTGSLGIPARLSPGAYSLVMTSAPAGYSPAAAVPFTVGEDGSVGSPLSVRVGLLRDDAAATPAEQTEAAAAGEGEGDGASLLERDDAAAEAAVVATAAEAAPAAEGNGGAGTAPAGASADPSASADPGAASKPAFFEKTGDWLSGHYPLVAGMLFAASSLWMSGARLLGRGKAR